MRQQEETFHKVNTYTPLRDLVHNIVAYIMTYNDEIWQLLKYPTADALSKPILTSAEKRALVYLGQEDTDTYRIFSQPYAPDDAVTTAQTRLYISTGNITPITLQYGRIDIAIDIIAHNKIQVLDTGENRVDVILQQLLYTLNGHNFGGITNLEFTRQNQQPDRASNAKFDTKFYSGKVFIISCQISDLEKPEVV
jgi:hypothetical protein